MTEPDPRPPGLVGVLDLIGLHPSQHPQDAPVRLVLTVGRLAGQLPNVPGLTHYRTERELWAAVDRGEFPRPTAGPWGPSWRRIDVEAWRRARRPKKKPRSA